MQPDGLNRPIGYPQYLGCFPIRTPPKNFNSTTERPRASSSPNRSSASLSQKRVLVAGKRVFVFKQRNPSKFSPALLSPMLSPVVDKDLPHLMGCKSQECLRCKISDLVLSEEAQECLVNQGRALQRVVVAFAAKQTTGHFAKFGVGCFDQPLMVFHFITGHSIIITQAKL